MKHCETFRVNSHLTDVNGNLRPGGFLRYMQETALFGMEADGPSLDELYAEGYTFLLSRLTLSVYADVYSHDRIVAQTWACDGRGYSFDRCYRVLRDDRTVAEASAVWALCRLSDRHLVRQGEVPMRYVSDEPLELDVPSRVRFPNETELSLVGERTVRYSDADRNGHMNNTVYADLFCDFVPGIEKKKVASLTLCYLNEAVIGDTLKVYRQEYDGIFYLRTVLPNGKVNAEAQIIPEDA